MRMRYKSVKRLNMLAALMILCVLFLWDAESVHAAQTIDGWSFEHNDLAQLGTADGADADGYNAAGNVSIASGGAGGTEYALKLSGANSGNGQWLYGLKSNTAYEISFYARIENWGGAAYPNFGVNGYDADAYVTQAEFTDQWSLYTLQFKTGTESTKAKIYTWIFGSGEVDFYIDEVSVREVGILPDWAFEHNDLTRLGTPDGSDTDGYNAAGNISMVSGGANNTNYALKISGANSGNGQWLWGLERDTAYLVTFYAKIENWGGEAYPNLGVNGYDGDAYVSSASFTGQWQQHSLIFRTGAESTSARIYTWIFGSGEVDFYIDEVTVTPIEDVYEMTIVGDDGVQQGNGSVYTVSANKNGESISLTEVSWQVSGMTQSSTRMEDGNLIVSDKEPTGTVLLITAKATVDGKTLSAIKEVTVRSGADVEKCNILLADDIAIRFFVKISAADAANAEAVLSLAEKTQTVHALDAAIMDGYYVFTVRIAAAQMTETVSLELRIAGNTVKTENYSVLQYAKYILEDEYSEFDDTTKALVREMLNYGAAAQTYFQYDAAIVDPVLIDNACLADLPDSVQDMEIDGQLEGLRFYGASLVFSSKTAVRFYFQASRPITDFTFTSGDIPYTPVNKDGLWYVEVADILPQNLNLQTVLIVTDGEERLSVSYGPMNYMVRMGQRGGTELKNVVKALYNYHIAACSYILQYDITYTGLVSDDNFALLYNTLGYEDNGTKKAFVRSADYVQPGLVGANSCWSLQDGAGNIVRQGRLLYQGLSYGLQVWGLDFSDYSVCGEYTLTARITDSSGTVIYEEVSQSFIIADGVYSKNVLLPLTVYNAQARVAPASLGGGYYDCNTTMGEAYSHGIFLNGLVQTWHYQKDSLDQENAAALQSAAARAFDYLLKLHDSETGEFIHSYPGRYNEDINLGYHNSIEALYGFSAYLNYFSDTDLWRTRQKNYERAVQSVAYLEENVDAAMASALGYPHQEHLIPIYYHLYQYSGDQQWMDKAMALIDKQLDQVNIRTMYRSGARGIPVFEGVYLFAQQMQGTEKYQQWIEKLTAIKDTYYAELVQQNAFGILPVSSKANAAKEWDQMWLMPAGEYDTNWYLTTGRACNAMDACFLGKLTGDTTMEKIAAGEIGFVFGLNPGFETEHVLGANSNRKISAGALIDNLNVQRVQGWYYWGFEMANDNWVSIMNGYRIQDGNYVFRNGTTDDWYYGETFIKHDGAYAYALCVYESMIDG